MLLKYRLPKISIKFVTHISSDPRHHI